MLSGNHRAIDAGVLNVPVEVQERVTTDDGAGGTTTEWRAKIDVVWCEVKQNNGGEFVAHGRIEARAPVVFRTHYRDDINDETDRLVVNGKAHNIRYIHDIDERGRWIFIGADRGVLDAG